MKPEHALKTALEKLAEAGIDYMITGSFAGNLLPKMLGGKLHLQQEISRLYQELEEMND